MSAKKHRAPGGRPTLSGASGSSPQVTFRLSPALREAAERAAGEQGVSLSEYAREALAERLHRPG